MKSVDLNIWCSQGFLASKLGIQTNRVHNWVQRGKIDILYVEELKMCLVRNISSISELRKNKKTSKKVCKKLV